MKQCTKKIMLLLVLVVTLNFIIPSSYSHADFGGVLMDPITDLFCTIGDAVINVLQKCMSGWSADFSLTDGGFLVSAEEANLDEISIDGTPQGNCDINPEEEFNKTLLTGKVQDYYFPVATYSPEQIFANKVAGLDINFIKPNTYKTPDGTTVESSASKLQEVIAGWYVALRNLTVVGLLSVLVYVGIRIIISSTAGDKAKYKQMFMDWLVALCLVFFLHYIMSFTLTMVDAITDSLGGDGASSYAINLTGGSPTGTFKTNLLGAARFKTQYDDFGKKVAYLMLYLALVIYTCTFTFFYLKRLLMMAFLTIIAPVVALTYPIDKMNDGKAQAFNSWLKEYVFNALIQPFHLIIYIVFVGSAMEFAADNVIYMIAALGFILPAEKILRNFFGFNKAGATLGAVTGAAALGSMGSKLLGGSKGGGSKGGGGSSSSGESKDSKGIRFEKGHDISGIEGESIGQDDKQNLDSGDSEDKENDSNELPSGGASAADANIGSDGEDPVKKARREALEEQIADGQIDKEDLSEEDKKLFDRNEDNKNNEDNQSNENNQNDSNNKVHPMRNFARAHNISPKSIAKGTQRAISGVAKFGTKKAFRFAGKVAGGVAGAAAMAIPAAVVAASGGGLAGAAAIAGAGFAKGSKLGTGLGDSVGNTAINLAGTAVHGVERGIGAAVKSEKGDKWNSAKEAMLGGTALGKELDTMYGDSKYEKAGNIREFKNNKQNLKYIQDQMTEENGGNIPSEKEVKQRMDELDPYISKGLNIKESLKANKVASQYGIDGKEMALITAVGKEDDITGSVLRAKGNNKGEYTDRYQKVKDSFLKDPKVDENTANQKTQYVMDVLKAYNGVSGHNLKKVDKPVNQTGITRSGSRQTGTNGKSRRISKKRNK